MYILVDRIYLYKSVFHYGAIKRFYIAEIKRLYEKHN